MAGLLFAVTEEPAEARNLVDLALPEMLHFPWLTARRFDSAHFSLALVLPNEVAPTLWHQTSDGWLIAIHGECYPGNRPISEPARIAEYIRQGLEGGGQQSLTGENGLYNIVAWAPQERVCYVVNDTIGALLLFYAQLPGGRVFASEPGAVEVVTGGGVDWEGLSSLLRIGYQADHRTTVAGIETLPGSTVVRYEVRPTSLVEQRFRVVKGMNHAQPTCREYVSLVEDAVRLRCLGPHPLCLPLTGGEDSRLLAGVAARLPLPTEAITLDGCQVQDTSVAADVALHLGLRHRTVSMDRNALSDHLNYMASAFSSTMDWHGAIYIPLFGSIDRRSNILLGFLGGTLAGSNVRRQKVSSRDLLETAEAHYHYRGVHGEPVRPRSEMPLALCPEDIPIQPTGAFPRELLTNLYGRQRRYTSMLVRLAWNFGRPVCPFADPRILDHAFALSRAELTSRSAQRRAFCAAFPDLARLRSGNDLLALRSHGLRALRSGLRGTAVSRLVRRWLPRFPITYDSGRLQPLLDRGMFALTGPQRSFVERWRSHESTFGGLALVSAAASLPANFDSLGKVLGLEEP
jgi:hypothetical protein